MLIEFDYYGTNWELNTQSSALVTVNAEGRITRVTSLPSARAGSARPRADSEYVCANMGIAHPDVLGAFARLLDASAQNSILRPRCAGLPDAAASDQERLAYVYLRGANDGSARPP
jgi:hypothetical protein